MTHFVYVAGPMRGHVGFNFAAFEEGEKAVRKHFGFVEGIFRHVEIANPAYMDIERSGLEDLALTEGWEAAGVWLQEHPGEDTDIRVCLGDDTAWISRHCTDMVMLPGWQHSAGAKAEKALAEAVGAKVWYLDPESREIVETEPVDYWTNEREDVLRRFAEELSKATGDGSKKRQSGLKPPWYRDPGHEGAIFSHLTKWKRGEKVDPDSGAHPLVHAAWRALAIACSENGNNPDGDAA